MDSGTKTLLADVGIVTLGGVVDILAEYVTLSVTQAGVMVGKVGINAGDAVGLGSAVAEVVAGVVLKKPRISLFGAGGLAMSVGTIAGKTVMAYGFAPAAMVVPAQRRSMPVNQFSVGPLPSSVPTVAVKGSYR